MCFRHLRVSYTTERIPRTVFKCDTKKICTLFQSKYSQSFQPKAKIIFPESSQWSVRRKLKLLARRKTSSVNTVFKLSSGFCSVPRPFRQSWHSRVFTLPYFSISVTISYPSAYMTFVLINCMRGLSFAVIHFTLTSIPARFWTQLWSVLLSVSYCKLVFSFPLHLPHLSSTYTLYQRDFQLINRPRFLLICSLDDGKLLS